MYKLLNNVKYELDYNFENCDYVLQCLKILKRGGEGKKDMELIMQ